jgi:protein involved in polysaccharide export with SLBB domain
VWNFDDQSAIPLSPPASLKPGDVLRLTCTHDPALRSQLPELRNTAPRYVVWGEGTTDEMCLGILAVTRP